MACSRKKEAALTTEFSTLSYLNKLKTAGADREFVIAVSAIWFLQASNDPNTPESQQLVGGILGTLENFFIEEARAVDSDVYQLYMTTIQRSQYGALFDDTQPIYTAGRNEVNNTFPPGTSMVMEIYAHYANVMLRTTKQDKQNLLKNLKALADFVDKMCALAEKAEREGL